MFPIMLRRLFVSCGFEWGVRISGFVCLAACIIACSTVTCTCRTPKKVDSAPWFSLDSFRDARYLLLIVASCFISVGESR